MALPLTHSSVNGPSKKLTGLVIGLQHKVQSLEKRRSMPYFIWIALATPQNFIEQVADLC
jgi:hypothetical protein